jgi:FAD synthase
VSLLNTREEKRNIIESMDFTHLVEIPFTVKFSDLEAGEFIKLLVDKISPSVVIIGYDHGFGATDRVIYSSLHNRAKITVLR